MKIIWFLYGRDIVKSANAFLHDIRLNFVSTCAGAKEFRRNVVKDVNAHGIVPTNVRPNIGEVHIR